MIFRRTGLAVLVSVLTLPLCGCGYSLSGRGSFLPTYIKTIGVPLFTNLTSVPNIETRITDKVRAELAGRGRYTVDARQSGVDAVLVGEITALNLAPAALNAQQQTSRYLLTLVARVELRDMKTNKVLWANPGLQFSDQFDVSTAASAQDPGAFLRNDINAFERLASEFARSVVSAMLEAF